MADEMGGELHALILGAGDDGAPASKIADSVQLADDLSLDAYSPEDALAALVQASKELQPRVILLANDAYSQELVPRLAHRLGGSSAGDGAAVRCNGDDVRVTRSVYGGKAMAVVSLKRSPAVVWIRARAMAPAEPRSGSPAPIKKISIEAKAPNGPRLTERLVEAQQGIRLEDARLIVSGGRGLGGPEPFSLLKQLAGVMGAEVAASRAACDAGWVPPTWQVGQTGKKVAPDLYMAIGISGASQHLIGIADAKVICAINTDPQAPIFKHCRFGLVEDYKKVVEPLARRLLEMKE